MNEFQLTDVNLKIIDSLDLKLCPKGQMKRFLINMVADGMGRPVRLPILVARGAKPGPTLGITAAIHGNEINGIPIVQKLFQEIQPKHLCGNIVGAPVLNVPGYISNKREFHDGKDLNRLFPGRPDGTSSQIYVYRLMENIISRFDYLVDLHTASFGRVNSLYVRANLKHPTTSWMARLQQPQIIVHKHGPDGSLRGEAMERGIPSITVEVGNPQRFQRGLIKSSLFGLLNVLGHLKMIPLNEEAPAEEPVICRKSYWLYTDYGGLLEVFPEVATYVRKNELIARVRNVFGDVVQEYKAPEDGIVVGKNVNPVNPTGSRILHLGIVGKPKSFVKF